MAQTGVSHALHGHLAYIGKQPFANLCDIFFLKILTAIDGFEKNTATFTQLNLSGTGIEDSVLIAGTTYKRSDGQKYTTDSEATVVEGVFTVVVTAVTAGAATAMTAGEKLSLENSVSGIDSEANVDSTATEGEDAETDEEWRARYLEFRRNPPQGGAALDYITLAKKISGVSQAWVLPGHFGESTIGVTFLDGGEIPSDPKVEEVEDYLVLNGSAAAVITAFAPGELVQNVTVKIKPNTSAVRDAVTVALQEMIAREAQVNGAYRVGGVLYDGKIPLSKFTEAISIATGETDHILTEPSVAVSPTLGAIARLGTITFETLA